MFHSFFPNPRLFFSSSVVWALVCVFLWYFVGAHIVASMGYPPLAEEQQPVGAAFFVTPTNFLFYLYFILCAAVFCGFWHVISKSNPWIAWSVWGSAFIVFITYFGVQIDVAVNVWRRPFFDLLQNALGGKPGVTDGDFYGLLWAFTQLGLVGVAVSVISSFFLSHYLFRWRWAMNNFYMSKWEKLRHIEGASQRVQEDTMRFATNLEGLGVSLIGSVMTLIVFLPILLELSKYVTDLPIIGAIPYSLVWLALIWSVFGTFLLALFGIKLPGLNFRNQRVEAAYRKELVYGEDREDRAQPPTVTELFSNVRRNYFRMYFHYAYFNVARYSYGQLDAIFLYFVLVPTFVAHKITLGIWQQIATAFGQVSNSFQYLVSSWTTIIELLSIHKRLKAFEAAIYDEPLPPIDQRYLEREAGVIHADG
ncbi:MULTISPECIES: peptide antibiotic transporter SbmA [Rhizobium]|uniref:Peptide antibiotic transporter SbmA n=1 Tax=Rhizobium tropici TaxID=398 RepID=A0A6P1C0Q6_RHITR|nr:MULTISPECIES: peptide antibiotic transporter SbmA [Rhizobium]AGB72006.1 SbmA/BacA-like family protein [Rhizobium tropici CIAT 899]NEV09936.1 peptide antibiotic transporter SbmA [Rhizobium tropici]TGE96120.1 peptide antibiotic transporter SbmA [Rhizobium sp. SEMIA 4088]